MRGVARRIAAGGVVVAGLAGVAWLSAAPVSVVPEDDRSAVRLSWRLRGEPREEACRAPTPEELAELPPHMRNPDACVGPGVAFRLRVAVDGREALVDTVTPAGARGDRPVFVLRDLEVRPGTHRLTVEFEPVEGLAEAYVLDERVRLEPRRVLLVTWDADAGRLVMREE